MTYQKAPLTAEGRHRLIQRCRTRPISALARRRCDTLYAMLRDGTLYQRGAAVPS